MPRAWPPHVYVCTLANHHVLDWGPDGLLDTLDTLDQLHVRRCGAGRDPADAVRPAVIELGERGRVAVFSSSGHRHATFLFVHRELVRTRRAWSAPGEKSIGHRIS